MRGILVMAGILVTGCGAPTLAPEAQAVRLTTAESQVSGCTSKGLVKASDGRGGFLAKGAAGRAVERKVREDAARAGANVVLVRSLANGFWGSSTTGEAFACPAT